MENTITYFYDNLEIIGAAGKNIYVLPTDLLEKDGEEIEACLVFTMTKWVELQKAWITEKKEFCERYNHFCGWGDITSHYTCVGEIDVRIGDEIKVVPLLKPLDFLVDMEHG
jgi:hypothetical protein